MSVFLEEFALEESLKFIDTVVDMLSDTLLDLGI